jgi:hypothetical protein
MTSGSNFLYWIKAARGALARARAARPDMAD